MSHLASSPSGSNATGFALKLTTPHPLDPLCQGPFPLMNASGAFNPETFGRMYPLKDHFSALVTKTVTPEPRVGNALPRTVELPGMGMLNSIGLQNPGIHVALETTIPEWHSHSVPLVLSLSAYSNEAFQTLIQTVQAHEHHACVSALELNLSCPNVDHGGSSFGSNPVWVNDVVQAVKEVTHKPIMVKLTPNAVDIVKVGAAAVEAGAEGLVAINTVMGMAIDITRKKPILPRIAGGYSGPGVFPIALHAVWQLHAAFPHTPIIAVGGASQADHVLAFLMAGASLVQVGTSCFQSPSVFKTITEELSFYAQTEGIHTWQSLRGVAH
ncbi:MAG: dihydroorotate dehydrogenase [Vampirovibrionales bacterium]